MEQMLICYLKTILLIGDKSVEREAKRASPRTQEENLLPAHPSLSDTLVSGSSSGSGRQNKVSVLWR